MRRVLAILVLFALLPAGPVRAQPATAEDAEKRPPRTLGLDQALDVMVRENPDLQRARVDLAIADAGSLSAAGLDDWVLTANGAWVSSRRALVAGEPFQTPSSDSLSLSAQITRSLATGGTVGLSLAGGYTETEYAFDFGFGLQEETVDTISASLVASVSQPLLRGRGREVARAAQERARLARDAAALKREIAADDAVLAVVAAYWELSYAIRSVAIREGSLDLAREQLRITREAIAGEVSAPTEALAIEQAIAVREQALLLARIAVEERSLELRRLVGLEVGPGEVELDTRDQPAVADGRSFDLDAALAAARERNPRLALLRVSGDDAAIEVVLGRDQLRPQLDVSASFGPTGNATEASTTFDQVGKMDAYTASANIVFSQPLGRRAARGALDRADQTRRRLRIDLAEAERQIAVSVVHAVNLVRTARKRIEVADLAVELAEQNLDNEKILYQAGSTRAFDVLARQDEIQSAKLERERAVVDYLIAVANVDALTGDLLPRHRVEIAGP